MLRKVWDEITYLFPNFSGATVEVWELTGNFTPHIIMDVMTYSYWVGLKLNHASKRGSQSARCSRFYHTCGTELEAFKESTHHFLNVQPLVISA